MKNDYVKAKNKWKTSSFKAIIANTEKERRLFAAVVEKMETIRLRAC